MLHSVQFSSVLFCSVLFCSVQFYSVQFCSVGWLRPGLYAFLVTSWRNFPIVPDLNWNFALTYEWALVCLSNSSVACFFFTAAVPGSEVLVHQMVAKELNSSDVCRFVLYKTVCGHATAARRHMAVDHQTHDSRPPDKRIQCSVSDWTIL